jgi:demethylmenaquinone methyltransferase/2-methoxy-6-polyprenyl-1,4-benzoquinol methylase
MFDRVAPYYDAVNAILSLGLDRRWRRRTAASLELSPGARVLDVATGTGALATEIHRLTAGCVAITGCDVNERMLAVARERMSKQRADVRIVRCDATELPFPKESFEAVTIGFAIDDMPDRERCAREMWRVLSPGGQIALLELGQPDSAFLRAMYRVYLRCFRLLRHVSLDGYGHLEREIVEYRGADAVERLLIGTGFEGYSRQNLAWGVARLHVARKPRTHSGWVV